ncbi:hypothetical protein [Tistrella mobilis]|uniref:hypothetical protein n=1 Tax=Tistrella mobilis TaxID=171437 RepID=UPI0035560F18
MATRPGFHPSTNFTQYPAILRAAIEAVGRDFYVTRSFNQVTIGNSSYWGILGRPSSDFSVYLNADREILFVLSTYENFEIRTLEAFDKFYFDLDQQRIDRSIRFLISKDDRIESIIQHYLNQNPEYPIIIPMNLNQINSQKSDVLSSIRRNYIVRDLFGYQNALREETFFFGRQEQVHAVLDLAKSGQSSSIFGLRKSGKTSSIYAIMRKSKSFGFTPILIDCQSPAVHSRRYHELLSFIINETRKSTGFRRREFSLSGGDADISEAFRKEMKSILGQNRSKILILFDEIENISPKTASSPHWENDRDGLLFWQNIRSFIQQDANNNLSICIVGTSPVLLEQPKLHDVANPMYLFSQKRFIPSFSFDETKEMIERLGFFMGLEFDAVQIATLQKNYGGHPFFIRQVCSNVNRLIGGKRPTKIPNNIMATAIEQFGNQLDSYLQDILRNLEAFYPDEFNLLKRVVSGDKTEISEFGREAPELVDHLIGYGLIEKRNDSFDVRFEAIEHALKRIFSEPNIEEFWTECMKRRNRIEIEIRREIYSASRTFSAPDWETLLKDCLTNKRFGQLDSIEPRILFSKGESPLYWTDLISILKSELILPYINDRRPDILNAMNHINQKGRKDAHAGSVSQEDIEELRRSFSILEDEFAHPE